MFPATCHRRLYRLAGFVFFKPGNSPGSFSTGSISFLFSALTEISTPNLWSRSLAKPFSPSLCTNLTRSSDVKLPINCGGPIGTGSPRSTCQKWYTLPYSGMISLISAVSAASHAELGIPDGEGMMSIPLFTSYSWVCHNFRSSGGKVLNRRGVTMYSTPSSFAFGLSESYSRHCRTSYIPSSTRTPETRDRVLLYIPSVTCAQ